MTTSDIRVQRQGRTSACLAALLLLFCHATADGQWVQQTIASKADFRGLCAVSANLAWVSGTKGTYGRTTDGGKTWSVATVPDAAKLDFRDVEAFNDRTAYLLSAGPGEASRIYKTTDGGMTWLLQFKNPDPNGFFDALAFWDDKNGVALGDPVKGHFQLLLTDDGGTHWKRLSDNNLPPALPNESAFAASGTCLIARGKNDLWFGTGGANVARLFHSPDRGQTWAVINTPILAGTASAGIFSIAFHDQNRGMIVGGDYSKPNNSIATAAVTADGGKTWTLLNRAFGYRSGVAWAKDRWTVVGTSGSDVSQDNGATWKVLDHKNYNSVSFTSAGEGWAAGPRGRIAKFTK
ncbi:MAG TPA: glycosyl hydrolase [Gemmataceae bacterium]|nr:glycosyl hydrolase [Gemmataceae bacterium]